MRIHTREKPFNCCVCEKLFSWSGELTKHMRFHAGEKAFPCLLCKKGFLRKNSLNNHMKIHHKEKSHQCFVSKELFDDGSNMRRHMKARCSVMLQKLDINSINQGEDSSVIIAEFDNDARVDDIRDINDSIIESENRSNIDNCNNADYKNDIMVILHTNDIKEEIK
jgi:hypothetical protein